MLRLKLDHVNKTTTLLETLTQFKENRCRYLYIWHFETIVNQFIIVEGTPMVVYNI